MFPKMRLMRLYPIAINIIIVITLLFLLHHTNQWNATLNQINNNVNSVNGAVNNFTKPQVIIKDASPKMVYNSLDINYKVKMARIFSVFKLIGFQIEKWNRESPLDFDVMWTNKWPFKELTKANTAKLKPHQLVTCIAGSGYVTNKTKFVTIQSSGMLPAFFLPQDEQNLVDFSKKNPHKLFVSKGFNHRHIKVQTVERIIKDRKHKTFVQEFLRNPLLIDGFKFEFDVYAYITTVQPLRIYIYDDIQVRFCNHKYLPFNISDNDAYIIKGSDYQPIWKIESFKEIYKQGYSKKTCLEWYLQTKYGEEVVTNMWKCIKNIITDVYLASQSRMVKSQEQYSSSTSRNYDEHVRFDFLMDDTFKVVSMEANFSPNLDDSKVPQNKDMFEQVVFNKLNIRGVTSRVQTNYLNPALIADKDILVTADLCLSTSCSSSCAPPTCHLCPSCLSTREKEVLKEAWLEDSRKHLTRRIFPTQETTKGMNLQGIDKIQAEWFKHKCSEEKRWCG